MTLPRKPHYVSHLKRRAFRSGFRRWRAKRARQSDRAVGLKSLIVVPHVATRVHPPSQSESLAACDQCLSLPHTSQGVVISGPAIDSLPRENARPEARARSVDARSQSLFTSAGRERARAAQSPPLCHVSEKCEGLPTASGSTSLHEAGEGALSRSHSVSLVDSRSDRRRVSCSASSASLASISSSMAEETSPWRSMPSCAARRPKAQHSTAHQAVSATCGGAQHNTSAFHAERRVQPGPAQHVRRRVLRATKHTTRQIARLRGVAPSLCCPKSCGLDLHNAGWISTMRRTEVASRLASSSALERSASGDHCERACGGGRSRAISCGGAGLVRSRAVSCGLVRSRAVSCGLLGDGGWGVGCVWQRPAAQKGGWPRERARHPRHPP